jgi:hypothetical protein
VLTKAGASRSPRVVSWWLHLDHLEALYADKERMDLEVGSCYPRCLTSAHKSQYDLVAATGSFECIGELR